MIIQTPAPDEVTGHAAEMYSGDVDDVGFVLSHTQALAVNPEAHHAFEGLLHAIVPSIGTRVYELAVDAGTATFSVDGVPRLTRSNFATNGVIAIGDQTNDPNVDSTLHVRAVSLSCQ